MLCYVYNSFSSDASLQIELKFLRQKLPKKLFAKNPFYIQIKLIFIVFFRWCHFHALILIANFTAFWSLWYKEKYPFPFQFTILPSPSSSS